MRSIILDGSDDWSPTIGGGNTNSTGRKTKWQRIRTWNSMIR